MPEKDGWHTTAFLVDGKQMRWHHCASADRDTLVEDTPAARAAHEAKCFSHARKLEEERRREARERSLAGLKASQEERKLEGARA